MKLSPGATGGILFPIVLVCASTGCSPTITHATSEAPKERTIQKVSVKRPEIVRMDRNLELTGEFRAWQSADLHAKVAGYLQKIHVDIGSRVGAGQVIAVLDAPELEADRTEQAAAVRRAESEELHAQAAVNRAKAMLQLAGTALARLHAVNEKEKGLIAGQEIDEARARKAAAEADVASAEASLQSSRKALEAAKGRMARVEAMLQYTKIQAPFAGVVTKRYADPGAMVQAGTASSTQAMPVVQIATTDRLRLTVVVPESAVPDVKVGSEATIRIPSLNKTITGRVARLTDDVSRTSRTMEAQIDVPNGDGLISPGMIAQVKMKTTTERDVVAIPVQAVLKRGGQAYVLTVSPEGKVDERRVEAGLETASHIEVITGLEKSDAVIVGARTLVQPGDKVAVEMAEESN